MSQGCSHCEIVADFWSAPSFVFLRKFQRSSKESLLELLSICQGHCASLLNLLSPCRGDSESSLNFCHHVTTGTNFSCNSCHHVRKIFCARVLCSLAAEDACFRMRITLTVVLIRSLVSTFVFRNVPGTVPECVLICGFKRNSSNLDRAPKMRDSVLLNSWDSFFTDSAFYLLKKLCDILLVNSRNGRVSWLAVPRMFLLCISCNGCQLSFVSQRCHFWRENAMQLWRLNYFLFVSQVEIITENGFFKINNQSQSIHSTDNQSDVKILSFSIFISPIYTFSVAGNIIVYTPSKGAK